MTRGAPDESGFVLPSVLAILIVITAAAALATQQLQTRTQVATGHLDRLRLQGVTDGIARLVAVSLINERTRRLPGLGLPENGSPIACPLPGNGTIWIAVQDQAGLIDLNDASRSLMEDAFRALGLTDTDAATIAAEIVDDRDADDNPEPSGGAEAPQYKARGLPYGPRNAPFDSIDELDRLPSMTVATAAILRPAVTVWNTGGGIDPTLNRAMTARGGTAAEGLRRHAKASLRQFYEVRVVAQNGSGARAGRAAFLSADARRTGVGLFAWQTSTALSQPAPTHPACALIARAIEG